MSLNRREFITWSIGGAFLLAAGRGAAEPERTLSPWIRIEPDGRVRLYSTVSDMGQGSRTGQVQILADELDVDWSSIVVEMAPDAEPYRDDGELFSGGSRSVRTRYELLRKAGAAAREQLKLAAAARWNVAVDACHAALGHVVHAQTGLRLGYGELAAAAALLKAPDDPPLKPAGARRYVGKPVAMLGHEDKIAGRATFGIDVRVPDMHFATLRQCPVFGGTLQQCDEAPALAVDGVRKVVKLPAAVAVVADSTWAAFRGAQALAPEWNAPSKRTDSRHSRSSCAMPVTPRAPKSRHETEAGRSASRCAHALPRVPPRSRQPTNFRISRTRRSSR
jgi:isoquinoline 1-oxidoreductase beta subunit